MILIIKNFEKLTINFKYKINTKFYIMELFDTF